MEKWRTVNMSLGIDTANWSLQKQYSRRKLKWFNKASEQFSRRVYRGYIDYVILLSNHSYVNIFGRLINCVTQEMRIIE